MRALAIILVAASFVSLAGAQQPFAQEISVASTIGDDLAAEAFLATLTAEQRAALLGWDMTALRALASAANPAAIIAAVAQVNAAALSGNTAGMAALIANLNAALAASGLAPSAIDAVSIGFAEGVGAQVAELPAASPGRSAAAIAITGAAQISESQGTGTATEILANIATAALANAPVVTIGAVNPGPTISPVTP